MHRGKAHSVYSVSVVVDNVPLIVDARIDVEPDGNWSLTLKGRVLEYDGNMGWM